MKMKLILLLTLIFVSGCSQSKTTVYASYNDAVKDGATGRGWVPSFIPADAVQIYESHNVESEQVVVTFSTLSKDFLSLLKSLDKSYEGQARNVLEQVDFPGHELKNYSQYYFRCTANGLGLMTFDDNSERFYYFEPVLDKEFFSICN